MKTANKMMAVLLACLASHTALAQPTPGAYPTKPVRIIVPFAPAGGSDQLARILGQKLGETWKQPFLIDNKPGAAGSIGTAEAARAAPDGYTLVVGTSATHGANPWIYEKLGYDPVRDFVPISILASTDYALAVPADSPIKSLADLIRRGRESNLDYGSSGNGSTGHIISAMLSAQTGVKLTHIPYKSAAGAMNDLMADRFAFMFDNTNVLAPFHKAGKMRIIATSGTARSQALPDIPTMAESGLPNFSMLGWWALMAPARTPLPIVNQLNREVTRILQSPEVRNTLLTNGNVPLALSVAESRTFVDEQLRLFKGVIAEAHIKLD